MVIKFNFTLNRLLLFQQHFFGINDLGDYAP